jgi:hypothetical protein
MPLPPTTVAIHPTREEKRQLEWLGARHKKPLSLHGYIMHVLREHLRGQTGPPAGYGPDDQDDD